MVQADVEMVLRVVEMLGIKGSFPSHQKEVASKVEEIQKLVDVIAISIVTELQGLQKAKMESTAAKEIQCVRDSRVDNEVRNLTEQLVYNVAMHFVMKRLVEKGIKNVMIKRAPYLTLDGVYAKYIFIQK